MIRKNRRHKRPDGLRFKKGETTMSNLMKILSAIAVSAAIVLVGPITNARGESNFVEETDNRTEAEFVEETFEPETRETEVTVTCQDLNRTMTLTGNVYKSEAGNKVITPVDDDYEIQIMDGRLIIYDQNYTIVAMSNDYNVAY